MSVSDAAADQRLSAQHVMEYAYKRSLGSVLSRFFTGLRDHKIEGIKTKQPRFAIRDPERRKAAIARWRGFLLAYVEAFHQWRHGEREVRFPEGTWMMKRAHCARCGPPLPSGA